MLNPHPDDAFFDHLRRREFSRLDESGRAYLDFAGSGLYGASQAKAFGEILSSGVFGNPHAANRASRSSEEALARARERVARHLGVDTGEYVLCFTANTSAAIKLVGEGYPFSAARGFVLAADNHNSVNGVREFARRRGAPVTVLPLRAADLRLEDPGGRFRQAALGRSGLLAFPAQSNFSGVRHPLGLIATARDMGWEVLLDAAGLPPSEMSGLASCGADYIVLSFYKMFGLPTGLGVLIARRECLAKLERPWFSGGTVDFVSVQNDRHRLTAGSAGFEDGTPDFLGVHALESGFALLDEIGPGRLSGRLARLGARFRDGLVSLKHADGAPAVRLHGPEDGRDRGATFAFNLLDRRGNPRPYEDVEVALVEAGVDLRGGCFCNPGAAEAAFGFDREATAACFDRLGEAFSIPAFSRCLGPQTAVGALRASLGYPNSHGDIDRALEAIRAISDRLEETDAFRGRTVQVPSIAAV